MLNGRRQNIRRRPFLSEKRPALRGVFSWRVICSENRFPLFGIMRASLPAADELENNLAAVWPAPMLNKIDALPDTERQFAVGDRYVQ